MVLRLLILLLVWVASTAVCAQSPATGMISGRVVNDSGQPLPGASLFVRAVNSFSGPRSTTTDAEGNFRLTGLEPALYSISASAVTYAAEPATTTTYYRIGDSVRLELVRGGVITGTVTTSTGEPLIGLRVRAVRIRDGGGQRTRTPSAGTEQLTDDRGVYRIYGLLPGTYLVSGGGGSGYSSVFNPYDNDIPTYSPSSTRDTAVEIGVRSGEESTADIRYRGEPGYSISGTVKVADTGVVTLMLRAMGNPTPLAAGIQQPGGRGFVFNGLADGEYTLRGQELQSSQSANTLGTSVSKRVTINGVSVTGLELIPTPLAAISGRVVLEPSKIAECQGKRQPLLAEMMVQLQRPEKEVEDEDGIYVGPVGGSVSPDASGALIWRYVRPGKYRFEPRFYARYWYLQSIVIKTARTKPQKIDAAATWTVAKPGEQLKDVIITLAEGAASLHGRLAVAEGALVQNGTKLFLIPAEPDKATDVLRFFVTEVAVDGTFTLNNLPPGKYLALTQANADASIATQAKLRESETEAARTKLRRTAEAKKIEIDLKPCQNLIDYQLEP
jgi:hypothetical protein